MFASGGRLREISIIVLSVTSKILVFWKTGRLQEMLCNGLLREVIALGGSVVLSP